MSNIQSVAAIGVITIAVAGVTVAVQGEPPAVTRQQPANADDFRPTRVVAEFPAITNAPVITATAVRDEVSESEIVLGVVVNGEARAYPINMLTGPSREIINDTLGGQSIAATW